MASQPRLVIARPHAASLEFIHLTPRRFFRESDHTEFDIECERLGLEGASTLELASSVPLRHWAKRYAKRRYVPTVLLEIWGIRVDDDLEMPL